MTNNISSFDDLKQAYFNKCRSTGQYLKGVRNIDGYSKPHFCLIGFEDGQRVQGAVQPIDFSDPFWWPAIAQFTGMTLSGEVLRKVEALPEVHDGIIDAAID